MNNVKRGVSLYSFQEEYFLRKMTLEDILKTTAELGITGVEILGDQMIPGYPNVPNSFYDNWHLWMDRYNLTPTCLDSFLDVNKYRGRIFSLEEMVESIKIDIQIANRLGCKVIRVVSGTAPEVLVNLAPEAEKYDVKLGVEVHSPIHFDHEYVIALIAAYEKVKSPYLGLIPDMGIYVKRFPRVIVDRWLRDGMKPEIADFITQTYNDHSDLENIGENVKKMGGNPEEVKISEDVKRYIFTDPRRMLDFMPYIFHIHAKFYEMLPDYQEYSIPYEKIIPVLIEGGYNGYLSSEYEGNRFIQDAFEVDSTEQIRLHQIMLKNLIGDN